MCGLYGLITTTPTEKHPQAFKIMACINAERGTDSTGVALVGKTARVLKDTQPADAFLFGKSLGGYPLLIGHNRYAVIGAITKENAQPFRYGDVIGTHNGILDNYLDIAKLEVDSMAIFYLLDKYGNDFVKAFGELRGSMACAWTYKHDLYLMRHYNPLYMLKNSDTIYYSSLEDALKTIKTTFAIKGEIEELPSDTVFKIDTDLNIEKTKVGFKPYSYIYTLPKSKSHVFDTKTKTYKPIKSTHHQHVQAELYGNEIESAERCRAENGCRVCGNFVKDMPYYYNEYQDAVYHEKCVNKQQRESPRYLLLDDPRSYYF